MPRLLRELWAFKKSIILFLTPLLLLPLPILVPTKPGKCAYAILLMAVYWMTEVIPMAATALLPIVLFPLLGVRGSKDVCKNYLKDTNMLFVGGLIVAVAVERWNLHKRIALRVLMLVGSQPKWLMFGFMVTTAFLSMWISNTATTAMMVPIAHAVLTELGDTRKQNTAQGYTPEETLENQPVANGHAPASMSEEKPPVDKIVPPIHETTKHNVLELEMTVDRNSTPLSIDNQEKKEKATDEGATANTEEDKRYKNMCKGVTLCVAYAANIGGTATLTGTGPNLIVKGQVDTLFKGEAGLNFSSWFIFAFPCMVLALAISWIWLQIMFLGFRSLGTWRCRTGTAADSAASNVIRKEYAKLGAMSFAEAAVLGHFTLLALLWITREPEFVPGWSILFVKGYVTDACVGIMVGLLLFVFPSEPINFMCCRRKNDKSPAKPRKALLDWEIVCRKLPWGVILVLGGGFALADACQASGLSKWIGDQFVVFSGFPAWIMVLLICIIVAVFTEVASNTATATIFLPILAELAKSLQVNPLYLMVPAAIATSFAFMLPVATPPNAIVFAYGTLKIIDMVKAGILMNVICVLVLTLATNTWGMAYFKLDQFPDWAVVSAAAPNSTALPLCVNASVS